MDQRRVPPKSWFDRSLERVTRFSATRPLWVLGATFCVFALAIFLSMGLKVSGSFVLLLPSESAAAKRFTETIERKGGAGSTLIVLVESPDVASNQKFIDELRTRLVSMKLPAINTIEKGPEEVRAFYRDWRWMFASVEDLTRLDCEISREAAQYDPAYLGLDDPCEEEEASKPEQEAAVGAANDAPRAGPLPEDSKENRLGELRKKFERELKEADRFPTNYYRTPDGRTYALLIRSKAGGMGEFSTDDLLFSVKGAIGDMPKSAYHPGTQYGFGGDIPNAIAERDALIDDMTLVSGLAIGLILGAIAVFFRSPFALIHIGLVVAVGCSIAFATARLAFGHLNAATSFLIAIIAGNGINPAIMYLGRYFELKPTRDSESALVKAALDTRRGTWLSALAAAGAYGALMSTSFRGFSEFGAIGAVGMVACWCTAFVCCPATLTLGERVRRRLGWKAGEPRREKVGRFASFVSQLGVRHPKKVLSLAVAGTVLLVIPVAGYLADPWEYNFSNLRSRSSTERGAGYWSTKANEVFASRGGDQLLLADSMERAPLVARQVKDIDQRLYGGKYVEKVQTVFDQLGGEKEVVEQKLDLLSSIRESIDRVKGKLEGEDRSFVEEWRPPEALRPLRVEDLPPLLLERFRETTGNIGTPVYVTLSRDVSQSRGENLLAIANVLENVRLEDGSVAPNASRASIFAEMIRSMTVDGPRAMLLALALVALLTVGVTRSLWGSIAVLGSLLCAVLWMLGVAAYGDIRLNFLNFVALPLTFGIGVEYAINIFDRVRAEGGDVQRGVSSAAGPVTLCSLTTILGYAALLKADNQALQSFGLYAMIGEFACILSAALLMPAGLWLASRKSQ